MTPQLKVQENLSENFNRYQIGLKTSMRGSNFSFDCVHLLYYKCAKTIVKQGGSCVGSPDWIENKKSNNKILWIKKIINVFNTF